MKSCYNYYSATTWIVDEQLICKTKSYYDKTNVKHEQLICKTNVAQYFICRFLLNTSRQFHFAKFMICAPIQILANQYTGTIRRFVRNINFYHFQPYIPCN